MIIKNKIGTLAQAEEALKENPFMYLVAFTVDGRIGSLLMASKEELSLYKIYFMMMETNEKVDSFIVTGIQKLHG